MRDRMPSGVKLFLPLIVVVLAVALVVGVILVSGYLGKHRAPAPQPQPQLQPTTPEAEEPASPTPTPTEPEEPAQPSPAPKPEHPTLGDPGAPVVMVEFADFYCPFCARFLWETFPQIKEEYIDKGLVRFEFRNLIVHGLPALLAAVAGECAAQQGRFWEFEEEAYARIFKEGEHRLEVRDLEALAANIGLDEDRFATCVESYQFDFNTCFTDYNTCAGENPDQERRQECLKGFNDCLLQNPLAAQVFADRESLRELMEQLPEEERSDRIGTPLFFIGNHLLIGAQPYENFKEVIDRALEEAKAE